MGIGNGSQLRFSRHIPSDQHGPTARLYDENCDGGYGGAIPGMNMSDAANMVGYNNLIENTRATDYIKGSGYLQYEPSRDW